MLHVRADGTVTRQHSFTVLGCRGWLRQEIMRRWQSCLPVDGKGDPVAISAASQQRLSRVVLTPRQERCGPDATGASVTHNQPTASDKPQPHSYLHPLTDPLRHPVNRLTGAPPTRSAVRNRGRGHRHRGYLRLAGTSQAVPSLRHSGTSACRSRQRCCTTRIPRLW